MDAWQQVCFNNRCVGLYDLKKLAYSYRGDLSSIIDSVDNGEKIEERFLEHIRRKVADKEADK